MKWIKNSLLFFFVLIMSGISAIVFLDLDFDPWGVRVKKSGTELEKFHLLLEENVGRYSLDRGHEPLTLKEKAYALMIMHSMNYKRDCIQAPISWPRDYSGVNVLSCTVNGKKIEYQYWNDYDTTGSLRFYPDNLTLY